MEPSCHLKIWKILFNSYLNNGRIITECIYGHNNV